MFRNQIHWTGLLLIAALTNCGEEEPSFGTAYVTSGDYSSIQNEADAEGRIQDNRDAIANNESLPTGGTDQGETYAAPEHFIEGKDDIPDWLNAANEGDMFIDEQSWTLASGEWQDVSTAIDADLGEVHHRLLLTSKTVSTSLSFEQSTRPDVTDRFTQGSHGTATDRFTQDSNQAGVLDIMLVVDNSGSMAEEQENLADKLDPLLSAISGSDWRIGITTTDPADGCLVDVIYKQDNNANVKFRQGVTQGTRGSGNERGILQAVSGLSNSCNSENWVRDRSTIAVLIVSDEDNCSQNGQHCAGQAYNDESYLLNYLSSQRTLGTDARIYGIISHPNAPCGTAYNIGEQYADAIAASNGTYGDICDSDYTATLQSISQNIATILKDQFVLSHTPTPDSVEVLVDGVRLHSGYSIVGNILEFSSPPAQGSQIEVSYAYGSAIQQSFTLSRNPAADTLVVEVNGVAEAGYQFLAESNALVFDTTPIDNAQISVSYRQDSVLTTEFPLGHNVVTDTIQVDVEGRSAPAGAYAYDAQSGNLQFNAAPRDGQQIDVRFLRYTDPVLDYPLPRIVRDVIDVIDHHSFASIAYQIDGETLRIDASAHANGREIRVVATAHHLEQGTIGVDLGDIQNPVVFSADARCTADNGLFQDGSILTWSDCGFADQANLTLSYEVYSPTDMSLDVSDWLQTVESGAVLLWSVHAGDRELVDVEIVDGVLLVYDAVEALTDVVVTVRRFRTP